MPLGKLYRRIERTLTFKRELRKVKPSRKLIVSTCLAVLVIIASSVLEGLSMVFLHEFRFEFVTIMSGAVLWLGATYWGRRA
jgi:hypothetical protein